MILSTAGGSRIRTVMRFAVGLAMFMALAMPALAEQQPFVPIQLSKHDSAEAQALAKQIAALSPRVDRNEAMLLAESAYATVSRLRREYRMFGTPIFNNFLVYHGLRKRGYCYQWTADLLVALDALKLNSLELHWGESYAETWRENNCLVVTAKGQPFERGLMLECWRHMGHLNSHLLLSDEDRYFENKKYAQRVLERSITGHARHAMGRFDQRTSGSNHHVAFSNRTTAKAKPGD